MIFMYICIINQYQPIFPTQMDAKISITTEQTGNGFYLAQFKTAELAVYSYYLQSNGHVLLIDPTYDTKAFQNILSARNAQLSALILTHYHADFLAGHTQFNAPIIMGPHSKQNINSFQIQEQPDGAIIPLGTITLKVIHTPGHTLQSSCFLLIDQTCTPVALFTGDTLFIGDVGRPDLAVQATSTPADLAATLFDSVQKLKTLDGAVRVYPAHGSGSSCGKALGTANFCTIQAQIATNYALKITQKDEFVKAVVGNLSKPPKYFSYDAKLNQIGSKPFEQALKRSNNPLSVQQFQALSANLPVIDTRSELQQLIRGSYWLPAAGGIITWMTNLFPPETEFLLFTESGKWEDVAQRFLRIGYFNIKGFNNFTIAEWKGELLRPTIVKFQQFKQVKDYQHLDVRNKPEYQTAGIVQNSILIPLPELPARVAELKDRKNIVVSCRTGLRARVAYSILAQAGIDSLIFAESFENFAPTGGLKVIPYA